MFRSFLPARRTRQPGARRRRPESFRPGIARLEDRLVPSRVDWIAGNGDFGTAANWQDSLDGSHHVPGPGDFAVIGNGNATVTVGASYSLDHFVSNCRLVLNSGAVLSLANPIDGSTIASLLLNSGGTLQTTGGTTAISGDSAFAGTFNTAAGATLSFSGGTQTVNAGTAFNGAGTYSLDNGFLIIPASNPTQRAPANFTLVNGTLGGAGTFEVPSGATFTWNNGTQAGPGTTQIDAGGTMTLVSGNKKALDGRAIVNYGTALISAADTYGMDSGNNAVWTNKEGALFDIETNVNIFHFFGNSPGLTINNAGTIRKAVGTTTFVGGVVLNNTGTLDLQSGTLDLSGGGTNSGTINLGDNTTLAIDSNSTFTLAAGTTVNGNGLVHVTGGGDLSVSGTVSVVNTSLDGDRSRLESTGRYTAGGTFIWNGGALGEGGGTIVIAGSATMTINGSGSKYFGGVTLENDGAVTWTGTGVLQMFDAGVVNNAGTWTIQTAQATLSLFNQNGLPSTFNNTGAVVKAGDNNAATISIAFNNIGAAVAVQNGMLNFTGGNITDGSTYTVAAGTVVDLLAANANLTVSGTISGTGAGLVVISGDGNGNGTVIVPAAGATFNFDPGGLQWTGAGIFTSDGGTLTNVGALTLNGTNDKYLNTNTPQSNHIFTLDNEGTILWTGTGRLRTGNGTIINNGTSFDIQTGDQGDGLRLDNYAGLLATFINAGSLTKSAGLASAHLGIDLENSGTVALSGGGLDLYGGGHSTGNMSVAAGTIVAFTANGGVYYLDAGASITGAGTTQVLNNSAVEVRAAVNANEFALGDNRGNYGTLQIDDHGMLTLADPNTATPYNFTVYNGGLVIQFSGSTAGAGYGQLNVGAAAQLGGNLYLTMLNGYRPAAGTTFQVLTYASRTQSFGNIVGTDLGGGLHLNPTYDPTDLTLAAAQTGPESGSGGRSRLRAGQTGIATSDFAVGDLTGFDLGVLPYGVRVAQGGPAMDPGQAEAAGATALDLLFQGMGGRRAEGWAWDGLMLDVIG